MILTERFKIQISFNINSSTLFSYNHEIFPIKFRLQKIEERKNKEN